jgi:signal transduction histidine kinase
MDRSTVSPAWWRRPALGDAALAIAVAALCVAGTAAELAVSSRPAPPAVGGYALALITAAVLFWRRRRPAAVAVAAFLLVGVYHVLGYPGEAPAFALFVAFYSLAVHGTTGRPVVLAASLAALAYVLPLLPPHPVPWHSPAIFGPVLSMLWLVLLGASVRRSRLDAEDRARRAAAVAEAEIGRRLAEERLRIAHDLHDALAHTISVIAVQSGNALDALAGRPDHAREALTVVRAASRQAMTELRATLGLLRTADPDDPGTRPSPQLSDLRDLAARTDAAGLRVVMDLDDTADELAAAVQLTAYRLVQEALTNALRHASARSVTVTVHKGPKELLVQVTDDGHGPQEPAGTGLGLIGMRERAEALGGRVAVGPGPDGGYQVTASLPL